MDGGAVKKALTASIAPAMDLAAGGTMMAGGNGPVKGIRIAGVVIEDASLGGEGGRDYRPWGSLKAWQGGAAETPIYSWFFGLLLGPLFGADCVGSYGTRSGDGAAEGPDSQ
jgi:hypothetical protein